jgi:hypothetical protein
MPESNTNGKKFGRRAAATMVYAALVTVAYYYTLTKGIALDWFSEYVKYMFGALGFLIGGLSAQHIFDSFKRG